MKRRHIYSIVDNPDRRSDCSFGCDDRFSQDIRVGWGSADSHTIANITVQRNASINQPGQAYAIYIDNELWCHGIHHDGEFNRIVIAGKRLYTPEWVETGDLL